MTVSLSPEGVERANPYLIEGPALISFSGGRTSAFMLWRILQAHGGTLPSDVHVTFANTGKEREETLRFVHECESRWCVRVTWLERAFDGGFALVDYNSASRDGEPFDALIAEKQALPNWQARWCTGELKVKPMIAYMEAHGHPPGTYREAIGLRRDEGARLLKMFERNEKDGRQCVAPLDKAGIRKADVMAFWQMQLFDLQLQPHEGNCDRCFLKGVGIQRILERARPRDGNWWIAAETRVGATFSKRQSYADIREQVRQTPDFFEPVGHEHDVECGLLCEPEAA